MSSSTTELSGLKFHKWTVIERSGIINNRFAYLCKCECGVLRRVPGSKLTHGQSKSCGCWRKEFNVEKMTTHGLKGHRLYRIWQGIKNRCLNPNRKDFKYYGGRGIQICDEWLHDFQSFYDWAMENGYSDELSIDRKEVNQNYSPDNCKWSTSKEQCNNRRSCVRR